MSIMRTLARTYIDFINQDNDLLLLYNCFPKIYSDAMNFNTELNQTHST